MVRAAVGDEIYDIVSMAWIVVSFWPDGPDREFRAMPDAQLMAPGVGKEAVLGSGPAGKISPSDSAG